MRRSYSRSSTTLTFAPVPVTSAWAVVVASCAAAGAGWTRSASTPPIMTARTTANSQRLRGMSVFSRSEGECRPGLGPGRQRSASG
ncbi:IPTL-CTERM sorting domain-containing protein [Nonomuraea sp. NPDC049784]|uniref:IPTL-CTERM sorting domain-containing protein n=1 Tax=Nonomuraea sp. NPDC049784 TaxID=3154361 RepID=UPI0033D0422E